MEKPQSPGETEPTISFELIEKSVMTKLHELGFIPRDVTSLRHARSLGLPLFDIQIRENFPPEEYQFLAAMYGLKPGYPEPVDYSAVESVKSTGEDVAKTLGKINTSASGGHNYLFRKKFPGEDTSYSYVFKKADKK